MQLTEFNITPEDSTKVSSLPVGTCYMRVQAGSVHYYRRYEKNTLHVNLAENGFHLVNLLYAYQIDTLPNLQLIPCKQFEDALLKALKSFY